MKLTTDLHLVSGVRVDGAPYPQPLCIPGMHMKDFDLLLYSIMWFNVTFVTNIHFLVQNIRGQSIKKPNFLNLLLYLQLNQPCLFQSTPLHSWYTASNVFSSSGTCFAGWREGPLSNFLLSPLPSEIGDLLVRILTSGTIKSPQGPNLESRAAGGQQLSHASSKIHGKGVAREQEHCHGAASRCCLSTPQASSFALPPSNASGRLGRSVYPACGAHLTHAWTSKKQGWHKLRHTL